MAFDFIVKLSEEFKKIRGRWRFYAKVIKKIAREYFNDDLEAVYVFGSTVRGDFGPLSDIDVAVVLRREAGEWDRAKFRSLVRKTLGDLSPFEIHIMTRDEWEEWYRRFVKDDFVKI